MQHGRCHQASDLGITVSQVLPQSNVLQTQMSTPATHVYWNRSACLCSNDEFQQYPETINRMLHKQFDRLLSTLEWLAALTTQLAIYCRMIGGKPIPRFTREINHSSAWDNLVYSVPYQQIHPSIRPVTIISLVASSSLFSLFKCRLFRPLSTTSSSVCYLWPASTSNTSHHYQPPVALSVISGPPLHPTPPTIINHQ